MESGKGAAVEQLVAEVKEAAVDGGQARQQEKVSDSLDSGRQTEPPVLRMRMGRGFARPSSYLKSGLEQEKGRFCAPPFFKLVKHFGQSP